MKITKIITKIITKTIEIEEVIDYVCNKCGLSFGKISNGHCYNAGIIEFTYRGNYHSKSLNDLEEYTFSLCEPCIKNLFDSFSIFPVKLKNIISN